MNLHSLAFAREAERLAKMAQLAAADQDERQAARFRKLAMSMTKRAN